MKKQIAMVLGTVFLMANSLSASVYMKEIAAWQPEDLQRFYQGEFPDTAIYFPKGSEFPVELFYSGDFFSLTSNGGYRLAVTRDFFVRMVEGNQMLFSLDQETWKPALELTTGEFQMGLKMDETLVPVVSIGGHLQERK